MKKSSKDLYEKLIENIGWKNSKKNKPAFDTLKQGIIAFDNERRVKILELLSKGPKTLSELSKNFKIDYKAVWKHVMILEKATFVILEKDQHKKGRPVMVYHAVFYNLHKKLKK